MKMIEIKEIVRENIIIARFNDIRHYMVLGKHFGLNRDFRHTDDLSSTRSRAIRAITIEIEQELCNKEIEKKEIDDLCQVGRSDLRVKVDKVDINAHSGRKNE